MLFLRSYHLLSETFSVFLCKVNCLSSLILFVWMFIFVDKLYYKETHHLTLSLSGPGGGFPCILEFIDK